MSVTPPSSEPSDGPRRTSGGGGSQRSGGGGGGGNRNRGGGQGQRKSGRGNQGGSGKGGSGDRQRNQQRSGQRSGQSRSGGGRSSSGGRSGSGSGGRSGSGSRGPGSRDRAEPRREPVAVGTPNRPPEATDEDRAAAANSRRALLICATPSAVVGLVLGAVAAAVAAPLIGVIVFVAVTMVLALWFWARAPHVVLGILGARPSDEGQHPRVHNLVEGLCATMGLPRPTIYAIASPIPNALAVGREPRLAALVVTSGLERALSLVELEGVLAHELVHVKRRDTATAGAAVAVVAPLAAITGSGAGLVRSLVGAGREFVADQRAASVVRYPPGLGSALETMTVGPPPVSPWPPGPGRSAGITRWLWIDPMVGARSEDAEGNLDDTAVRAAALAER